MEILNFLTHLPDEAADVTCGKINKYNSWTKVLHWAGKFESKMTYIDARTNIILSFFALFAHIKTKVLLTDRISVLKWDVLPEIII